MRRLLILISILLLAPALTFAQTDQMTVDDIIAIKIPGLENLTKVSKNATEIPFLAEYIAGLYRYGVYAATVIAAFMLTISGFQYAASAGNASAIKSARQRALNAVLALAILYSSYILLYALNPQLVTMQSLSVKPVGDIQQLYGTEDTPIPDTSQVARDPNRPDYSKIATICYKLSDKQKRKPTCVDWCNEHPDEKTWPTSNLTSIDPAAGNPPPLVPMNDETGYSNHWVELVNDVTGITYENYFKPDFVAALKIAGVQANAEHYVLLPMSGFRNLFNQIKLVCKGKDGLSLLENGKLAQPGDSAHGKGNAIDVQLGKRVSDKKECPDPSTVHGGFCRLTCSGAGSCAPGHPQYSAEYAKILLEIMDKAGFKRLQGEMWHFEYATNSLDLCTLSGSKICIIPQRVKAKAK